MKGRAAMQKPTVLTKLALPLVSIIVPIYNVEAFLTEALESIAKQTYQNLEVLLVDDGATDRSHHIAQQFVDQDSRFQLLVKQNGGLSDARNFGLMRATGEYLYYCDSDDIIDVTLIEKCVDKLQKTNSDVVIFDYQQIDENGTFIPSVYGHGTIYSRAEVLSSDEALMELFNSQIIITAWSYVVKRELLLNHQIKFTVGRLHEDVNTTPKVFAFANQVAIINEPLYQYRVREGSIVSAPKPKNLIDTMWMVDDLRQFIQLQDNLRLQTKNEVYRLIFDNLRYYLWNISSAYAKKNPTVHQRWLKLMDEAVDHLGQSRIDRASWIKYKTSKSLLFVTVINKLKKRKYFF